MKKSNPNLIKIWRVSLYALIALGMLLLNAGCTALPIVFSAHTSTSTQAPATTMASTVTPSPSQTPAATTTPTVTPGPSQTPVGFYINQSLGFSLIYPVGWSVSRHTSSQVLITDSYEHIGLIVQPVDNHLSLYQCIDLAPKLFKDTALGKLNSSKLGANDVLVLADGTKALHEGISAKFSKGGSLTMQVVCAQSKTRLYAFFIFGSGANMKAHADVVDGIYKSIRLE